MTQLVTAAAPVDQCVLDACALAVVRALDISGRRRRLSRQARAAYEGVPGWEYHTLSGVRTDDTDRCMAGIWDLVTYAAPTLAPLVPVMDDYVRQLIAGRRPHDRQVLAMLLSEVNTDG